MIMSLLFKLGLARKNRFAKFTSVTLRKVDRLDQSSWNAPGERLPQIFQILLIDKLLKD